MLFPTCINPYAFTDTLPLGSSDTAGARFGAQQMLPITTVAPMGRMYLTFVVFAYPNANSAGPAGAPLVPIVEILTQPLGLAANPWQVLSQTEMSGNGSINLASSDQFVDYTYISLGAGLFQIAFQQNNAPFDDQIWMIRFTINDGVTNETAQSGLTFTLDLTAGSLAPWIALPAQPPAMPGIPINYGSALAPWGKFTLAGSSGSPDHVTRGISQSNLLVPIGNYSTAPLTVTKVVAPPETNGFSTQFAAAPIVIAPGCVEAASLQISYFLVFSQAIWATTVTTPFTDFTLLSNDPLAEPAGLSAHVNVVSFYAMTFAVRLGPGEPT